MPERTPKINVIDAPMGTGKTYQIHKYFNNTPYERFMFITPRMSEITRVQEACPERYFIEPDRCNSKGSKAQSLTYLINGGGNIATSHALVDRIKPETLTAMAENGGDINLVIDEVIDCIKEHSVNNQDLLMLLESGSIIVGDGGIVNWNETKYNKYSGAFTEIRDMCVNKRLYLYDEKFLIFELHPEFLKLCKSITVLTYMYEGSIFSSYCKANGIDVVYANIDGLTGNNEIAILAKFKELITVEGVPTGRGNMKPLAEAIGKGLTNSWFKTHRNEHQQAMKSISVSFLTKHKLTCKQIIWTTRKADRTLIQGKGYTSTENGKDAEGNPNGSTERYGYLEHTAKATNEYDHIRGLMYWVNKYPSRRLQRFIKKKGSELNEDLYALSSMIQWVWRSRIRKGEPIVVLIPSNRMRSLFIRWLNGEFIRETQLQIAA